MFDEFSIVETAISSFNNAALFSPYFFAIGLLCIPLFYLVYVHGHDILARLKWNKDTEAKIGFWSVLCLVLWLLLFGGNYAVIRDGISLLPIMISFVLFVSTVYITQGAIQQNYLAFIQDKKLRLALVVCFLLFGVLSAKPDLYGILLQLSALFCGVVVGSRLHKNMSNLVVSTLVFVVTTSLILMQPEYFRFGQLGNLTIVHLLALLITGFFAVTVFVSKYTKARSKINESAYIKLKWFFRIVSALALVLFVSTESVPVFIGLLIVTALSEILTIYHSKKDNKCLFKCSWALLLVCFGILITCPVLSCLGVLYMLHLDEKNKIKDFTDLL